MSALWKAIQAHVGVDADGVPGEKTAAAVANALGLHTALSDQIVIPDDYWPMLAKIESGNRPYVKAPTSSASGLYQFIRSTWIGEGGKWGPNDKDAFGGLRPSEAEQLARAKTFTMKNALILQKKGIPINRASLYSAHFLGAGTATKLLAADDGARADEIAGGSATQANPSILRGKTVAQFLRWLQQKTGQLAR